MKTSVPEVRSTRKTLVVYVGYARLFDGGDLAKTAYGSELALLSLVARLIEFYDVYVFGASLPDQGWRDGVYYGSSAGLRDFSRPIDILIISRYLHYFLEFDKRAAKTFIWCHDTCLHHHWDGRKLPAEGRYLFKNLYDRIDGVVVLSEWHKRYFMDLYEVGDEKLFIIGNGIDPEPFQRPQPKIPNKLVWSSSPDRGLDKLMEYLDEVRIEIPDVELFVYRGEEDFTPAMQQAMAARPFVHYGGKRDNAFIIQEYLSADMWVYPTDFHETYCISALEAQMAGCVCVCSKLAALETTVGDRGVLIDAPLYSADYKAAMVSSVVSMMKDGGRKEEYRTRGRQWAGEQTWEARAGQWMKLFGDDVAELRASPAIVSNRTSRPYRIKMLCNWTDSQSLCDSWNRMTKGDYRWNDILITAEDAAADYFCIVNHPGQSDTYDPTRTIVLRMEEKESARPYFPPEWIDIEREKFLFVFDERNSLEWHLGKTYRQLLTEPAVKSKTLSAVISDLYALSGHKKRLDFLKYLESKGLPFDLYGRGRNHGLTNYLGELPYRQKDDGILPYRYTVAVESVSVNGYFTEKLIDAILGECLCFYWGCPDLESYIDPDAFIRIDLDDFDAAYAVMTTAIAGDEWSRRIATIRKEKMTILTRLQVLPVLETIINKSRITTPYHAEPVHKPHGIHGEPSNVLQGMDAFVINLDRRPDRMEKFSACAARAGFLRYSRRAAVDGTVLQLTPEVEELFGVEDPRNFAGKRVPRHHAYNAAVIGCALSHYRLWQQLVNDVTRGERDSYLIIEDDARLAEGFVTSWNEIYDRISGDLSWDLIYLGMHDDQDLYGDFNIHEGVKQFTTARRWHGGGTHAYCIRKQGARKMIEKAKTFRIQQPIDHFMIDQFDSLMVYKTVPYLVHADMALDRSADTDIQGSGLHLKSVEQSAR